MIIFLIITLVIIFTLFTLSSIRQLVLEINMIMRFFLSFYCLIHCNTFSDTDVFCLFFYEGKVWSQNILIHVTWLVSSPLIFYVISFFGSHQSLTVNCILIVRWINILSSCYLQSLTKFFCRNNTQSSILVSSCKIVASCRFVIFQLF